CSPTPRARKGRCRRAGGRCLLWRGSPRRALPARARARPGRSCRKRTVTPAERAKSWKSMGEAELLELLAQRAAVDAENSRSPALVALGIVEHHAKERLLDLAQHEIVEIRRPRAVEAGEVIAESALRVAAQRQQRPLRQQIVQRAPVESGARGFP